MSQQSSYSSWHSSLFDCHGFVRTDVAWRAKIELAAIFVLIFDNKSNPENKSTVLFQTIFYVKKVMPRSTLV